MLKVISSHVFLRNRLHPGLLETFQKSGAQGVELFAARQHFDYTDRSAVRDLAQWFRSNATEAFSMHAPLSPATRAMMNAGAFAKMKKGAFLINTARGPLIDEAALVAALDAGHLGGAALDVVTEEPLAKDSALLGRDNVILTPHTAFYSVEALEELQTKCASDVARVLSGEKAIYPISA